MQVGAPSRRSQARRAWTQPHLLSMCPWASPSPLRASATNHVCDGLSHGYMVSPRPRHTELGGCCDYGCSSLAPDSFRAEVVRGHRATLRKGSSQGQPLTPETGSQACHPGIKRNVSADSFFSRSSPSENSWVVSLLGALEANPSPSIGQLCLSGFCSPFKALVCALPFQPHGALYPPPPCLPQGIV